MFLITDSKYLNTFGVYIFINNRESMEVCACDNQIKLKVP